MKPPSGGPSSGPTSAGSVTQTMALISSRLLTLRTRIRRPTGVIIAPPMPSTMRATTNWLSEPDSAQPIEPSMNTAIAGAEHRARAEAVGGPAADRDEDGKRKQVGGNGELERQRVGADVGGDRRQRGRDDGRVHVLHEQGDRHDQRDDAIGRHGVWSLETARGSKPCAYGSRIVPGTGKQALWWRKRHLDEARLLLLGRSPR